MANDLLRLVVADAIWHGKDDVGGLREERERDYKDVKNVPKEDRLWSMTDAVVWELTKPAKVS